MSISVDESGALTNAYSNFIAVSRYARWNDELGRRETWTETVDRFVDFFRQHLSTNYGLATNDVLFKDVRAAILNLEVMPSMRALMTAGPALERSHIAGYNCSFIAIDDPRAWDEGMYILLNGTGVGFSVEQRHVDKLPVVPRTFEPSSASIVVSDSKEGWANALRQVISLLYVGKIPTWDMSLVRPAGSRLKTFGGRASGPGPLDQLFRFTVDTFVKAAGRQLTALECHDIMCKVGDIVVSGGVRRSALISLSDLDDIKMAEAKSGQWWERHGQRALANNSAVYLEKPSVTDFMFEWRSLVQSQSGERGIYNLAGARAHASAQGRKGELIEGTNPCGEILLRPNEFCNLTEVVLRSTDSYEDIRRKVRLAAVIGTWQSTLTDFPYLRPEWRQNCEEERLLGVSLTGIYGHRLFNNPDDPDLPGLLEGLRNEAHRANIDEAQLLGISPSAAITCVKPSGTVSQLTGVSSGIHPWHSEFYIRTVRGAQNDPLSRLMSDYGVPAEPDVMKPDTNTVFSFPMRAPEGAVTRDQISALQHLKLWALYREHWTDHNPSVTINVRDEEWLEVANWVYQNWDKVGGISFLPHSEHTYQQAPYQEITEAQYLKALAEFPGEIKWADLSYYEVQDGTSGSRELACAADGSGCEVVDLASA